MGFWWAIFMWLATTVIGELLRPSQNQNNTQPAGLGDFQVPTAQENRKLPIPWGTVRMRGPNVVWYGDLSSEAITERIKTGLFSSDTITRGYRYFLGVQLGLSVGPVDEVTGIWIGEDRIWTGSVTTSGDVVSIDEPEFFGGDEGPGANGGFVGDFRFHLGEPEQAVNAYLGNFQQPTPAYRHALYAVFERGYIGNSPRLDSWSFEVSRFPNGLGVTGGEHVIGRDANPICCLYELVTDQRWGLRYDEAKIDGDQWRAVASTVFAEDAGFSMILDSVRDARDVANVILRHVDGVMYTDPRTGLLSLRLARADYVVGDLLVIDEDNAASLDNFSRGSWTETANQVEVNFEDRSQEYSRRTALQQDPANIAIQGEPVLSNQDYPGVKTADLAARICARELKSLTIPLAKGSLMADREAWQLNPGEPFVLDWPSRGISGFVARVQQIRPGTPEDGRIGIDFVEDIYGNELAIYSAPQPTSWVPPQTLPGAALRARLWEVPYQVSPDNARHVATLVTANPGLQLGYDVIVDLAGGSNFVDGPTTTVFTPSALLDQDLITDLDDASPYTQTITIKSLTGATVEQLIEAGSDTLSAENPANLLVIGDEVMFFESALLNGDGTVDLQLTRRGSLDTIPAPHLENDEVWFIGLGVGLLTTDPIADTVTTVTAKVLPFTLRGTLDPGAAPVLTLTLEDRVNFGIPPNNPTINGERFVDLDWTRTPGTLEVEWKTRNRETQNLGTEQTDASVPQSGAVRTNLTIRRVDNDSAVLTQAGIPGGEYIAQGFAAESTPGVIDELDYYIELVSSRGGVESQAWRSRDFQVFGFGANFGSDFGGDEGGVVLAQGDPPFVPDPIPNSGTNREWRIIVGGTYDPAEELEIRVDAFDQLAGEPVSGTFTIDGGVQSSLEGYAIEIELQLNQLLAGRPFTVIRQGTSVRVSSRFGSFSVRFSSDDVPGSTLPSVRLRQAAGPALNPIGQTIYIDWFTTEEVDGVNFDVLAPNSGDEYTDSGTVRVEGTITPLTYAAELAIEGRDRTMRATTSVNPLFSNYNGEFPEIIDALNTSQVSDLISAFGGLATGLPLPQARSAIVVQVADNYRIGTQLFESHPILGANGYKLLIKEGRPPSAGDAAGLAQVTSVTFFVNPDSGDFTGLDYVIEIGGQSFAQEVQAPGDAAALVTALDLLVEDIDAATGLSAERTDATNFAYELTIQTANTVEADVFAYATTGVQVQFSQTI